ncbi:MAG: hypothetical protein WC499_00860 [Patescibacteria group bacterium]
MSNPEKGGFNPDASEMTEAEEQRFEELKGDPDIARYNELNEPLKTVFAAPDKASMDKTLQEMDELQNKSGFKEKLEEFKALKKKFAENNTYGKFIDTMTQPK